MPYSVLMSVYKKEQPKHLSQAIDSMLHQTIPPNEFVLVCDGPLTVELDDVITQYEQTYKNIFKTVRLDENVGLGLALNQGLLACSCEIIARMDSDDVAVSTRMELQLAMLEQDSCLAMLGGQTAEFQDTINDIHRYRIVPLLHDDICKDMAFRNPFNHMTVTFRKKAVLDAGNYQHLLGYEDYDLWARMIANGSKVQNINEVLCYVRVDENAYARRSGWTYFTDGVKMQKELKSLGLVNHAQYCRNIFIRFISTVVLPNNIRSILYKTVMRKKNNS